MSIDLWFTPQLDVVAVEFVDRGRGLAPVHRIAVVFRDGSQEIVDVRPAPHHGVPDIFAAAIPDAISQRRTSVALQDQYERLRTKWFKQLDCLHKRTVSIEPDPLNGNATIRCMDCDAQGRGGVGGMAGSIVWRHIFYRDSELA